MSPRDRNRILEEAFELVNGSAPLRRISGVLNVIVYDKTQTPPPPEYPKEKPTVIGALRGLDPQEHLTFWWRVGGLLNLLTSKADAVVGADSWRAAIEGALAATKRPGHEPARLGSLQFWGHGSEGKGYMANDALSRACFSSTHALHPLLNQLRETLDRDQGSVWFRCCEAFRGANGKAFARTDVDFFKVPVVGHTFIIWALQSGTQVLKPGHNTDWPDDQGYGRKDHVWSDPLRKKTISALKFYPPSVAADFLGAVQLVTGTKHLLGL